MFEKMRSIFLTYQKLNSILNIKRDYQYTTMKAKNILLHAILISLALQSEANSQKSESEALNYHLQHAGTSAHPADPNAAVCVDGVYHLHYIYNANGDKKKFRLRACRQQRPC